ncbi:hypothetical protein K9L67_02900 [Candidatus Woesearchaeota archaeon]|nr:hypothetical protein [Candidatus Woesearchaeota archaeon]MCF7901149.1 hypothetical protein [Candidatus Woesearchaeota archaeon]MCF8013674.1 hypothetical protein [Candidatus Woesearchaeota archaeon]
MDDEYELLSHKRIQNLRDEVDRLKSSNAIKQNEKSELISSINRLDNSINKLITIFEKIGEGLQNTDMNNISENANLGNYQTNPDFNTPMQPTKYNQPPTQFNDQIPQNQQTTDELDFDDINIPEPNNPQPSLNQYNQYAQQRRQQQNQQPQTNNQGNYNNINFPLQNNLPNQNPNEITNIPKPINVEPKKHKKIMGLF